MILKLGKSNTYIHILQLIILGWIPFEGQSENSTDTISYVFENQFLENIQALQSYRQYCDVEYVKTIEPSLEEGHTTLFGDALPYSSEFNELLNGLNSVQKENLMRMFADKEKLFMTEIKALDLPEDLKYLAPALSAMNPLAVGQNSQAGLWQLQHFQGVLNGLIINDLVDERFNETRSTKSALQQVKYNESIFGSVELAVVAYLAGNTTLNNALSRVGSKSVEDILAVMPAQIQYKIAAFQAMSAFLKNHSFRTKSDRQILTTLSFSKQVHFKQIAQVLNCSEEKLKYLNPQYKFGIIPGDKKEMNVKIPVRDNTENLVSLDSIYNAYDSAFFQFVAHKIEYPPAPNRQYVGEKVKNLEIEGKTKIKYTIKSGDVLGFIAEEYDVRVADLKYWNNIYNERRIQAGKQLDIFVDDDRADFYTEKSGNNTDEARKLVAQKTITYEIPESARKIEHTVKSGESPYVIAKKYGGVTPEAILYWNGISDARKIQIGQKLIIYTD